MEGREESRRPLALVLTCALGFLQVFLCIRVQRAQLGLTLAQVYGLTLMLSAGVLVGGRAVEVFFDEWGYPTFVPRCWLAGMATHGLLIGAAAGTWLFARTSGASFLMLSDALAVPGAFLMGIGRIGGPELSAWLGEQWNGGVDIS